MRFAAGSFFDQPMPKADVVMMGHILHDWDLETKRMLIAKAYEAMPAGGALVVYESIIDDDRSKNAFGLMMSLNMLIETPGGFDYTGADCMGWMQRGGVPDHAGGAPGGAGVDGGRASSKGTVEAHGCRARADALRVNWAERYVRYQHRTCCHCLHACSP